MSEAPFDLPRAHRWFAVEFNNQAWDAIEAGSIADLAEAETDALIDTVHAASRHWRAAGEAIHYLRAQVLLTTLYARLGYVDAAVRHAAQCLKATEAIEALDSGSAALSTWDEASALGSAALAYAVAGDDAQAATLRARADAAAAGFEDPEETTLFHRLFDAAP